ncbi:DM13 domain [Trinorchestia longiramus]|nr:DM13 domain [Trinorchestia longiramus]
MCVQVGGEVYAVNRHSFHIRKFMYDGNGKDTFFWAGSRPRPGPQGFIVPNENGRTNVLRQYHNDDITIILPDGKTISEIRWLSVYDLTRHEPFGDLYIPEGFEAPQRVKLNRLTGKTGHVNSDPVIIVDSKTIRIDSEFSYCWFMSIDSECNRCWLMGIGSMHNHCLSIPNGSRMLLKILKPLQILKL